MEEAREGLKLTSYVEAEGNRYLYWKAWWQSSCRFCQKEAEMEVWQRSGRIEQLTFLRQRTWPH